MCRQLIPAWREAAPGLVPACVCSHLDAPGRHLWEMLSLVGDEQTQADGGERWRCSILLFSSTVSASWCRNRIEDGPERAAFSCSMHSKPNCYLWFQLSFFMAPIVKDTKVIKVTKLEGFCSACSRAVNVLKCFGTLASWNLNFSKGWMQNLAN